MGENRHRESTFRFKRFSVNDAAGAMKVGTDGVLVGAWADVSGVCNAVDVGAGTALIALMLAQRGVGHITAFEINRQAAEEAIANVAASPWPDAVKVMAGDALTADIAALHPQLIVSNPPFFTETLQSPDQARAAARHQSGDSLGPLSLLELAAENLEAAGSLAFISPAAARDEILFQAAIHRLYPSRITTVRHSPCHPAKRILWQFAKRACPLAENELCIRDDAGAFTAEYLSITSPFYL